MRIEDFDFVRKVIGANHVPQRLGQDGLAFRQSRVPCHGPVISIPNDGGCRVERRVRTHEYVVVKDTAGEGDIQGLQYVRIGTLVTNASIGGLGHQLFLDLPVAQFVGR